MRQLISRDPRWNIVDGDLISDIEEEILIENRDISDAIDESPMVGAGMKSTLTIVLIDNQAK